MCKKEFFIEKIRVAITICGVDSIVTHARKFVSKNADIQKIEAAATFKREELKDVKYKRRNVFRMPGVST